MKPPILLITVLTALQAASPAGAAQNSDPDWPCIQRKVPELSIGQVWTGGDLGDSAKEWDKDPTASDLADQLVRRSNPIENARKQIADYAAALPKDQLNEKLELLFMGVFDKMNAERDQILSGISRYAGKQREMAADIRRQAAEVDKLQATPGADQAQLSKQNEQLTWETRVFEERVQSLTYVCEVPTLVEQRLYTLSKAISGAMTGK